LNGIIVSSDAGVTNSENIIHVTPNSTYYAKYISVDFLMLSLSGLVWLRIGTGGELL
jgi:hypothetical protein